ncbi:sulfotransferase family 2 domain-containing protein [Marichromatium sp. AB31]|uniref:sulfotransferase family 2 domain-containing protein n=1 Tax=Marichromatium sp. AB31 TaxID=2483362 RepID=UPI00168038F6|nr:sulfotransferase family 2 domain-containing protein [Marichromatium sp. AB31]
MGDGVEDEAVVVIGDALDGLGVGRARPLRIESHPAPRPAAVRRAPAHFAAGVAATLERLRGAGARWLGGVLGDRCNPSLAAGPVRETDRLARWLPRLSRRLRKAIWKCHLLTLNVCPRSQNTMLLSHHRRFVYFHIPKTGGSSLTSVFRDDLDTRASLAGLDARAPGWQDRCHFDGRQHSTYRDNARLLARYPDYFRFAFVRNPWDLALSWYIALARASPDEPLGSTHLSGPGFKQFLRRALRPRAPGDWLAWASQAPVHRFMIGRSQSDYVTDRAGRLQIDFLARFEHYQEDLTALCDHLGLAPPAPEHFNRSRHGRLDYREFYDTHSRDWIARRFRRDIELFGYRF